MLHYSDIFKISNYKISMDSQKKIQDLKLKINELKEYLDDFIDLHQAKKNKISNLEKEIKDIKNDMNKYLDEIEKLME